jgi:hypothetical protein
MTRVWSGQPSRKPSLRLGLGTGGDRVALEDDLVDAVGDLREALRHPSDPLLDQARLLAKAILANTRGIFDLLRASAGLCFDDVGLRAGLGEDLLDLRVGLEPPSRAGTRRLRLPPPA